MKIIFLGYEDSEIISFLKQKENEVFSTMEKLSIQEINNINPDIIISYGYRHIIKKDVVEQYKNKIINLHISLLPWNKGTSPNFWSCLQQTPNGVTIHYIDEGIDTGDILLQKHIIFPEETALKDSYNLLRQAIERLFIDNWEELSNFKILPTKQNPTMGNYHSLKDTEEMMKKLNFNGNWNLTIKELRERV